MKVIPKEIFHWQIDSLRVVFVEPLGKVPSEDQSHPWRINLFYLRGFAKLVTFGTEKEYLTFLSQFEQDPRFCGTTAQQYAQWSRQ